MADHAGQQNVSKDEQRKIAKAQKSAEKAAKAEKARLRAAEGEGIANKGKPAAYASSSQTAPAASKSEVSETVGSTTRVPSSTSTTHDSVLSSQTSLSLSAASGSGPVSTGPSSTTKLSSAPSSRSNRGGGGGGQNGHAMASTLQQAPTPTPVATSPASPRKNLQFFGNVSSATSRPLPSTHLVSGYSRRNVAIHPSILALAVQLSNMTIIGANARALAVLGALRDFVAEYRTPTGAALSRDLVTKLGPQISHLVEARPLGTSVGNSIRYLKYEISVVPPEMDEAEAKEHLLSRIDHFIRDRIVYAGRVIEGHAGAKIRNGDTVLTFGRSSVVQGTLLTAWASGKRFHVIVVDSRPLLEGKRHLATLLANGVPCTYGLLTSLATLMPRASLVLLGTASLLANGALYARSGTASCAMLAQARAIPVIVCCETYKFSDRVQLDAFVANEAANPCALLSSANVWNPRQGADVASLLDSARSREEEVDSEARTSHNYGSGEQLTKDEVEANSALSVVNLLYDLTPPRYISAVASEVGLSGPESVGVILRDYKSVLYGV